MKKHLEFSVVLLLILDILGLFITGCSSTPAMPSGGQRQSTPPTTQQTQITIVNNTGYTIWYVYISPSTDTSWGPDHLADDQELDDGQSVTLTLPNPVAQLYDIRLEDSDGDTYTKESVRVTANARIVFTLDDIDV